MILVKKSLALYGKNGIIADGTDEKRLVRFEQQTELPGYFACGSEMGRDLIIKKGRIAAPAPIKKGPNRGQVQLSFASVILS